jgi:C-terminal processing protease CtpA/Prc
LKLGANDMKAGAALSFFIVGMACGVFSYQMLIQGKNPENKLSRNSEDTLNIKKNDQPYDASEYENQIAILEHIIQELEEKLTAEKNQDLDENKQKKSPKAVILTQKMLVDAGIDEVLAQEIIKRKDDHEYKLLDLRDRATREKFIGTTRFRKELSHLKNIDTTIRDELGDDVFGRYLYASGRTNQVKVSSIMQGSPAEYAGIVKGDVIISYDGEKIFSWHDLNRSTAKGQRDDMVLVDVKREDEIFNILVPRGPLGVKLEVNRILP